MLGLPNMQNRNFRDFTCGENDINSGLGGAGIINIVEAKKKKRYEKIICN